MKKENTRQKIITAALNLFNEKGYEGATTNLIAQQAGVNELTLFRHFKNKKNLIIEMVKQFSPINNLKEIIQKDLTGNIREDLVRLGLVFIKIINTQGNGLIMGLSAALLIPEMKEIYINIPADLEKIIKNYLEGQLKLKKIRNIKTEIAAKMFIEMLFGLSIRVTILGNKKINKNSLKDIIIHFIDIFINGITIDKEQS